MKKVQKLSSEAEQTRRKLTALTSKKAYHSFDTECGVLTVDNTRKEPTTSRTTKRRRPKRLSKP